MHSYAQTIIQLLTQLRRDGYSKDELYRISRAYEQVMRLFTGLYRPSGKTVIAHSVGTASILSFLHVSEQVVSAGLVHAAYTHGDFGSWAKGISDAKREQVRRSVGDEVEEYVARYTALQWNARTIPVLYEQLHSLEPIDRTVLLIRIANELDDLLDLGVLYCFSAESKLRRYTKFGYMMIEMADKLGFPNLGTEIAQVLKETVSAEIPPELRSRQPGVNLIAPRSFARRLSVAICQDHHHAVRFLHSVIGRIGHGIVRRLHSSIGLHIGRRSAN